VLELGRSRRNYCVVIIYEWARFKYKVDDERLRKLSLAMERSVAVYVKDPS
jgi:hypothetical protein